MEFNIRKKKKERKKYLRPINKTLNDLPNYFIRPLNSSFARIQLITLPVASSNTQRLDPHLSPNSLHALGIIKHHFTFPLASRPKRKKEERNEDRIIIRWRGKASDRKEK